MVAAVLVGVVVVGALVAFCWHKAVAHDRGRADDAKLAGVMAEGGWTGGEFGGDHGADCGGGDAGGGCHH